MITLLLFLAAVVEHSPYRLPPSPIPTASQAMSAMAVNLDRFDEYALQAAQQGADLIVFPEDALTGDAKCARAQITPYTVSIPEPAQAVVPCSPDQSHLAHNVTWLVLMRLSCMARAHGMAVVADLPERVECSSATSPECPADGQFQFNTQVAFDEEGALVGKYRKNHLFYEPQYNVEPLGKWPDTATFTLRDGTELAMLVCFDLMFGSPALDYVADKGIKHVVYSTWWINTPPYFSATQYQQSWARTLGVNLIAAGNGDSATYSGSGLFTPRGDALASQFNPTLSPADALLIANMSAAEPSFVSRHSWPSITPTAATAARPFHCPKQPIATPLEKRGNLTLVPFTASWTGVARSIQASAGEFLWCEANVTVAPRDKQPSGMQLPEVFVLMAYSGWFDVESDFYVERFCAVFRCSNLTNCYDGVWPYDLEAATRFERVTLEMSAIAPLPARAGLPSKPTVFTLAARGGLRVYSDGGALETKSSFGPGGYVRSITATNSAHFNGTSPQDMVNLSLLLRTLQR